jgi:hypothetical protein
MIDQPICLVVALMPPSRESQRITMKPEYFCVDVLLERVPIVNRWADEQWRAAAVVPIARIAADAAPGAPGVPVRVTDGPTGTQWRFPGCTIELHPTEAEGYYLNITSDTPLVFVMWRTAEDGLEPAARVQMITVSYNQAGRIMDGGERVDPVPMPEAILAWMRPYVAQHYKPEPRRKMRRNDPFKDDVSGRDRPPRG